MNDYLDGENIQCKNSWRAVLFCLNTKLVISWLIYSKTNCIEIYVLIERKEIWTKDSKMRWDNKYLFIINLDEKIRHGFPCG